MTRLSDFMFISLFLSISTTPLSHTHTLSSTLSPTLTYSHIIILGFSPLFLFFSFFFPLPFSFYLLSVIFIQFYFFSLKIGTVIDQAKVGMALNITIGFQTHVEVVFFSRSPLVITCWAVFSYHFYYYHSFIYAQERSGGNAIFCLVFKTEEVLVLIKLCSSYDFSVL